MNRRLRNATCARGKHPPTEKFGNDFFRGLMVADAFQEIPQDGIAAPRIGMCQQSDVTQPSRDHFPLHFQPQLSGAA